MTQAPAVSALIEQARAHVRKGGTIQADLSNGITLGPNPVSAMALDENKIWFNWAGDDHAHGHDIRQITAGDDGEVILDVDGGTRLTIWGVWDDQQVNLLNRWYDAVQAGSIIVWVGLDPTPAWTVSYTPAAR